MSIGNIIRGLNFKQLLSLVAWFLKHPIYMICTMNATVLTFRISQKEFPNIHGLHNKANAFRHALWNLIIASKCHKIDNDMEAVLNWTEQITDWHEDFTPNEELMRMMDLHNNKIGREMYRSIQSSDLERMQAELKHKLSEAVLVSSIEEINIVNDALIYLKD